MTAHWDVNNFLVQSYKVVGPLFILVHGTGHDRGLNELLQEVTRTSLIQIIKNIQWMRPATNNYIAL